MLNPRRYRHEPSEKEVKLKEGTSKYRETWRRNDVKVKGRLVVDGRKNKTKIARVKKSSRCIIPTENDETENRSLSSVVQRG